MWDDLREFLYSLSSALQETAASSHPLKLERALVRKLADTTASRYLAILLSFCQRAQESEVDLSSCRAVSLLDLVYSMQSGPKLIDYPLMQYSEDASLGVQGLSGGAACLEPTHAGARSGKRWATP